MASGVQVVVMSTLTILASPTKNLQNFKDKHAEQAAINNAVHVLLNSRGWKQLIFKKMCV